ncbi:unannotated protein [freshwater metagenome]|uniref:Unannotated protein n=1 Tax=freshwater metagenome TaxID=449393 RepID=A0A6J6VUB7_9ZZZZ
MPRSAFHESNGDATEPWSVEYAQTASIRSDSPAITPSVASLCPAIALVAECSTSETPNSRGRWIIGVAKVESTTVNGPRRLPSSSRSASASLGLDGVSARTSIVRPGRTASRKAPGSVASTSVTSIPNLGQTVCRKKSVPP